MHGDATLYTLWPIFTAMDLGPPISARAFSSHTCNVIDHVANPVNNDFSFPTASTIQFQYAAHGEWPAMDLFWYEGGMRPRIPELEAEDAPLPIDGAMWVGDKGKIITSGTQGRPRLFTSRGVEPLFPEDAAADSSAERGRAKGAATGPRQTSFARGEEVWVQAIKGGPPSPGNILIAGPISETVCLAAVALRAARQKNGVRVYPSAVKVHYDSANMKITNLPEANQYLTRDYRPGWEL